MGIDGRLRKLEALITARDGERPTAMRLALDTNSFSATRPVFSSLLALRVRRVARATGV